MSEEDTRTTPGGGDRCPWSRPLRGDVPAAQRGTAEAAGATLGYGSNTSLRIEHVTVSVTHGRDYVPAEPVTRVDSDG